MKSKFLTIPKNKAWLFVLGSTEGHLPMLEKAIESIEDDLTLAKDDKIIILGNFLGRNKNNREVIDFLRAYQSLHPDNIVILRGATEQRMVSSKFSFFISELGKGILKEYETVAPYSKAVTIDKTAFANDREWLSTLPYYYKSSKFFFVHAGVNPRATLDGQVLGDLLKMNNKFYTSNRKYEKVIIHSMHSPVSQVKSNRIGIGKGTIGKELSCLILNDSEVSHDPKKFIEGKIQVKL